MEHTTCPHYQRTAARTDEFREAVARYRSEIEANMRALGLNPTNLSALVMGAAIQGASYEATAMEAAITPLTYDEVSREGNVKPVSHPVHARRDTAFTAYLNSLKQLGIYAATEKVSTKVADKSQEMSPLEQLMGDMSGSNY